MSKQISIQFVEREIKFIFEAMIEKKETMEKIMSTSTDEDEVADIGNDFIELSIVLDKMKEIAVKNFGDHVLEFSREPLF